MECKKSNTGFSLIEMIVTIAIMAVVLGGAISIYSLINSSRLNSMAENIDDAISDTRSRTLAKSGEYRLKIYANGDDIKAVVQKKNGAVWDDIETTILGKSNVKVTFKDDHSNNVEIKDGTSGWYLIVSFNKSDGTFNKIQTATNGSGTLRDIGANEVYVTYANKTKTIKMLKETGKHYIE